MAVRQLREQVETQRLRLEQTRLDRQLRLSESVTDSIYGTPVPLEQLYTYRGQSITPIWFRDPYQAKGATLRLVIDYDRSRNLARYAYETNPNAQAVINGLAAYVVASGYDVVVTPKKRRGKQEAASIAGEEADPAAVESEQAQAIIDEFVEVNELKEAADGCPIYDEAFTRSHVDGECLVRLFPDEEGIETTRCRFIEPDNIRPPLGANWEGPWSFGILTSGDPARSDYGQNLAWDTQTVRAYNVNYPLVNRDEQVLPQFMFHLKSNVKKNQKRGISSLYSTDEDLRGTQKLRYAAREGAKIRASIPYVREHQQADLAALQSLQESLVTATVPRTDQWANQHDVNVQQIEPGSVVDIPESLKMNSPPADPNADAVEQNLKHGVETIAARFNAPAWLVGGASNDSSYAASLTSESPFLRVVLKQQAKQVGYWKAIFKAVLEIAIEQRRLAEGALERLSIVVKAQNPQARNKLEESQTNKLLHDEGVISLQTWTADSGNDFDEEQAERREEETSGIVPEKVLVLPPWLGGPNGQQPPGKQPKTIGGLRQREEGVREQAGYAEAAVAGYAIGLAEAAGWDESKHPRGQPENAGEFAKSGGSGEVKKGTKIRDTKTGVTYTIEEIIQPKGGQVAWIEGINRGGGRITIQPEELGNRYEVKTGEEIPVASAPSLDRANPADVSRASELKAGETFRMKGDDTDWTVESVRSQTRKVTVPIDDTDPESADQEETYRIVTVQAVNPWAQKAKFTFGGLEAFLRERRELQTA